jgi:hypothetical protein
MLEPMIMKAFFEEEPEKISPCLADRSHSPRRTALLIVHGDRDTLALSRCATLCRVAPKVSRAP